MESSASYPSPFSRNEPSGCRKGTRRRFPNQGNHQLDWISWRHEPFLIPAATQRLPPRRVKNLGTQNGLPWYMETWTQICVPYPSDFIWTLSPIRPGAAAARRAKLGLCAARGWSSSTRTFLDTRAASLSVVPKSSAMWCSTKRRRHRSKAPARGNVGSAPSGWVVWWFGG